MHILLDLKFSAQNKQPSITIMFIFGTISSKNTLKISMIISRLITQKLLLKISNILVFATICGENGQMPLPKKIQHFTSFLKLIRKMSLFRNSIFSKSNYKKKKLELYSGVLRSL